ncbi:MULTISPECIES: A24 family peptidase [unclassified Novosphingobium]|uniref:A24 family peptidase n=1 Tax=unclassified Novosphingobium TaxID=2644732 RepID=UPI00086B35FC|nr:MULTISPECIES: prepilin peptidase [unclassified Novosphingobium]MBN9145261.1 prepilin peptidase [Novosphingobium sp.]MDR6709640.1 prepilin peptidase CpaA [Novosphingobium sp. 1748]ODU80356.1 MAG: peptidase [Novosphingobium sp. SCN 63-17]OJX88707.1 MAG: peptidase [Novosphingobium sp. 63-713]
MLGSSFSYGLLIALAIALLVAAYTDIRRRQIDNWLNAGIALAAPLFWWASHMGLAEIGWQLALAAGAFVVLAGLFAIGAMGGGDVKLLVALALWIKPVGFAQLLMVMAVSGGVLTVALAAWHVARRHPRKPSIPYGIAIALGGLWVIASGYLFPAAGTVLAG